MRKHVVVYAGEYLAVRVTCQLRSAYDMSSTQLGKEKVPGDSCSYWCFIVLRRVVGGLDNSGSAVVVFIMCMGLLT